MSPPATRFLVLLVVLALPGAALGSGGAAQSQHDARLLSADPNAAVVSLGWRDAMRAKVSVPIPIYGGSAKPAGLLVRLLALIELHNHHGSSEPIPSQQWRGRLGVAAGWRLAHRLRQREALLTLWVGAEHESDHRTYPSFGIPAVVLNDLYLRGDWTTNIGNVAITAALVERLHVLTCTVPEVRCHSGLEGSASFETGAELVVDWGGTDATRAKLRPYVSLLAEWMFATGDVQRERRVALRTGVRFRPSTGLWQLYLHALAGNDVGIERDADVLQLGGGIAWSP